MHPEALTEQGREIFKFLPSFSGFYLAGGTALALQIGHRQSVDFDLFSGENIGKELLAKAKRVFNGKAISPVVNNPAELTFFVDGIKITFLAYPFPMVTDAEEYEGVRMFSIKELGATKAYTVGRRGTLKDYADLHAIVAGHHTTLEELIQLAEKKYGSEFNARLFLEQLIFVEDIEETEIVFLPNQPQADKEAIQKFFEGEIKKLVL